MGAVVIPFDETEEYYLELIESINGILCLGGYVNIYITKPIEYYDSADGVILCTKNAAFLLILALEMN